MREGRPRGGRDAKRVKVSARGEATGNNDEFIGKCTGELCSCPCEHGFSVVATRNVSISLHFPFSHFPSSPVVASTSIQSKDFLVDVECDFHRRRTLRVRCYCLSSFAFRENPAFSAFHFLPLPSALVFPSSANERPIWRLALIFSRAATRDIREFLRQFSKENSKISFFFSFRILRSVFRFVLCEVVCFGTVFVSFFPSDPAAVLSEVIFASDSFST